MPGVAPALPKFQFLSSTGAPLANGTVTVYLAGTTTPTNTWQDSALSSLNTNPIQLDARGEAVIWLDSTKSYKFLLKNSAGSTQWTQDDISGVTAADTFSGSDGSSYIGFIQAGVGAVARTVQAKLREIVSPADTGDPQAAALLRISGPADAHNYCANPDINQIAGGFGNTIAGGGYSTSDNEILGATNYRTISGGYDNTITDSIASTISGGAHHNVLTGTTHATVGGGSYNDIEAGDYGTISGGTLNTVLSTEATIAGGTTNTIGAAATASTIGGGSTNSISNAQRGTISGGLQNQITAGNNGTIGGGTGNSSSGISTFVAGQTNTVSGNYSIAFGLSNTVSAPYAAAWGRLNTVSKEYGAAYGYQAVARSTGRTAAGGRIAGDGDAQYTDIPVKGTTTANTTVYLTGSDANQFICPMPSDNVALSVVAEIVAVEPATGDTKAVTVRGVLKRIGGVNTTVGSSVTVIYENAGAAAWTAVINLSTNNLRIGVSGDVGKTVRWAGKVTVVEVSF